MRSVTRSSVRLPLTVTLLLAVAGPVAAADAPEWVKSYTVSGRANVRVHTNDGSVRIMTSDTQQVEFRVKTGGTGWGFGFGDDPRIESRQDGDLVELNAHVRSYVIGFNNRHTDIEVSMPKNADLQIETSDGSIDIATVNGNVRANTSDGSVKVAEVNGNIDISTSDGSIEARTLKGKMKLRTSDGSIRATELDGPCEASSSDGRVKVEGRFDALDVHSGDGSVTARIASGSAISSAWQVSSSDGSVDVALPPDFKVDLDVSTGDGHITLDLPVQVQGELSKSRVHGALNGGGPSFRIHSSNGSIHLSGV
jgi:DUF4097 and DUF4098 domain-containing protein YvlB